MTSKEIYEKINEVIDRKGLSKRIVSEMHGIPYPSLLTATWKKVSRIYLAMDILDAVGLELQFDNIPIRDHQDFIDFVNGRNPVGYKIAKAAGVNQSTIRRLRSGEDVSLEKAMKIIDAMGIEVRVV